MQWQIVKEQRSSLSDLRPSHVRCIGDVDLPSDSGILFCWHGDTYLTAGKPDELGFLEVDDNLVLFDQGSCTVKVLNEVGKFCLYSAEWDAFVLSKRGRFISYSDSGLLVVGGNCCCHANFLKLNIYFIEIDFSNIGSEVVSFQLGSGERRVETVSEILQEIGSKAELFPSMNCAHIIEGEHEVYQL
jgi:hypothetical protein